MNETRLNLACGRDYREGYVNIDDKSMYEGRMKVDMEADVLALEWKPESVIEVLVCHFMMYIPILKAQEMIDRWYSWLQPGGQLVIETGDLKAIARTILVSSNPEIINGTNGAMQLFGWDTTTGHKWAYCYDTLAPLLAKAGFKEIGWKYGGYHQRPERDITVIATK